jgi:hypothetical protein
VIYLTFGQQYIEIQLTQAKAVSILALVFSVNNDIIDTVATHVDSAASWAALRATYHSRDQSHILALISQLQTMKLFEGGSVEDYIK